MPESLIQLEWKMIDGLSLLPTEKNKTKSIMMLVKISHLQVVSIKSLGLDHNNPNRTESNMIRKT